MVAVPVTAVICVLLLIKSRPNTNKKKEYDMYCSKCGMKNEDNAAKCIQCGNDLQGIQYADTGAPAEARVPTYLAQAILVTIFCCLPFGIPAIVFAAQVNGKLAAGDYAGAVATSKKARKWCWVSFGVGIGITILYILIGVIAGLAGM